MFGGAFGGGAAASGGATTMAREASISMMAAKGAAFHDGGVQMFASGGAFANRIVNKPTSFPIGIMGEAGPEAIMPLGKDAQGRLGIRVSGDQGGGNVENNVTIAVSIVVHNYVEKPCIRFAKNLKFKDVVAYYKCTVNR